MKTYEVKFKITGTAFVEVEANSREEAEKKPPKN